jgi:CrcB protein
MFKVALIGLGGCIGAVARYGLSGLVHRYTNSAFPYGTLVVNVVGCFFIGAFLYYIESRGGLSPQLRLFAGIGVLGAFTTFSTFGYETIELAGRQEYWSVAFNILGNVFLGLTAVWLGRAALRLLGL